VYPETFLQDDTSWLYFLFGTFTSSYLVMMFSFHVGFFLSSGRPAAYSSLTVQYYKAIIVRPGSPLDPPRVYGARTWTDFVPSALCVGPLRGPPTRGKEDRGRMRAIKEISAAHERASTAAGVTGKDGGPAGAERHARTCKKCPLSSDMGRPPKPGTSKRDLGEGGGTRS
jgi:hypothetical protein